jgi:hypothetical protein
MQLKTYKLSFVYSSSVTIQLLNWNLEPTLSVFPWTPEPTDKNCRFSHSGWFLGSSAHSMGTHYCTQIPGAEWQAVFQACQSASSSAKLDSTPTSQFVNFRRFHHGVVNHSQPTLNLLTGISATRTHFYLYGTSPPRPPLLAASWSADHNKMAAFTGRWMFLHKFCIICMAAHDI